MNQFNEMEQEVFQAMAINISDEKIEEFIALADKFTTNLNAATNK
ncbi:hypothetical protein GCM10008107_28630 [Psychrosphaera saromensis]|nr:hypothetical protein [Psychrosphaera saromensis]GHB77398.1 hypothetical protein GCM10008107_28630 [Psychrosphaera saromensis]GLQ12848.1 hypothetical protein GCM10007917_03030 [Psychrosphaera saromensis]